MRDSYLSAAMLLLLLSSCGSPFGGDTLIAMRIDTEPADAEWERSVPLDLEVWMGNVNLRPEVVALDQETSHRSTAQCHHGPANSQPVKVRLQAWYTDTKLYLLVRWPDPTEDRDLGRWEKMSDGWTARPKADDGIAILWGTAGLPGTTGGGDTAQEFRCQKACHMMEVDVYDGGTQMRMGMRHDGDLVLDLWRWRAGVTDPSGLADDMVVDREGKRGDEGLVLTKTLLAPVSDIRDLGTAPYREVAIPLGRQAQVRTKSSWVDGWWHVLFVRDLDSLDPDDTVFTPGLAVPFSISVFDSTFTEHHVLDLGAELVLVKEKIRTTASNAVNRRDRYEPLDF
jgi:hypothetical protein